MSQYIDGELDLERAGRLSRHVRCCAECARLLRSLRGVAEELRRLDGAAGADSVVSVVLEKLQARVDTKGGV